jgi:hypothetical protein
VVDTVHVGVAFHPFVWTHGQASDLVSGWVDERTQGKAVRGPVRVLLVVSYNLVWNVVLLAVGFLFFPLYLVYNQDFVEVLRRLL